MSNPSDVTELDQQEAAANRAGPSLVQVAWQRKPLVILGLMLGLVLGTLYYAQREKVYQSFSQMLVVKKTADSGLSLGGSTQNVGYMEDYMSTQSIIIRSPEILMRALKLPILQDMKSFTDEHPDDRAFAIRENLAILRDNKDSLVGASSNVLQLTFKGPNSDDCRKVLQAIIDSYQNFLNETYRNVSEKTLELITQAREILRGQLEQDEQKFAEFRKANPILLFKTPAGGNMYSERLSKVETKRAEYRLDKAELEEKLSQVEKAYKEGGKSAAMDKISVIGLTSRAVDNVGKYEEEVLKLQLLKKKASAQYGASHPTIKELDEQIELYRTLSGGNFGGILEKDGPSPVGPVDTPTKVMKMLKDKIDGLEMMTRTLDNMFEQDKNQAREIQNYEVEEDRHKARVTATRELLATIVKRLNEINLVKDFGGYEAKVLAPPGPGRKVLPNGYTVFPIATIGGLLAGLCLAYLAELSDKSFRTPAEIRRRLGLPVIGHIPYFAADEKAQKAISAGEATIDPMICTHYSSNSVSSEAYRSVRTALYFNTQGIGHQVIQVTSPNMADGKSTLAANLAVSIAQSGKKTIIIDADCRRPRIHKVFAVPHDTGLASVIAGQADLTSAIKPTAIPNLSVLPCGPRPANPAELLTSPRFKELLDIIRAQYDYVIVDTPPLLVVTDPCVVAPRVDGVVLAIRVTKNGRPFAERAKEILTSLGANCLGVVVNGLGGQAGGGRYGYGYDSYNYGYGYTYRYSYTYTDDYTDDKASSYYTAPDNPDMPQSPPPAG